MGLAMHVETPISGGEKADKKCLARLPSVDFLSVAFFVSPRPPYPLSVGVWAIYFPESYLVFLLVPFLIPEKDPAWLHPSSIRYHPVL